MQARLTDFSRVNGARDNGIWLYINSSHRCDVTEGHHTATTLSTVELQTGRLNNCVWLFRLNHNVLDTILNNSLRVAICNMPVFSLYSEWMSERLHLTAFLGTADNMVHVVHTSRAIIAYTLEWLSFLTQITHNLQATINFKKKDIKKETQKVKAPIELTCHWRWQLYITWGKSLCYSCLAAISRITGHACMGHSAPHTVPLRNVPHE